MKYGDDDRHWWTCRVDAEEVRWIEVCGPYEVNGVVTAMTAKQQLDWANSLRARLPTAEDVDAIWREADVRVDPLPRNPSFAAYTALNEDIGYARRHHDQTIAAGKTWVESERATVEKAVNYGWHVPLSEVRPVGGEVRWRGIKVHKDVSGEGYVIQPPSAVHGWTHVDYSQLGYCVRDVNPGYERVTPITTPATPEAIATTTIVPPPPILPHDTDPISPALSVELPPVRYIEAKNFTWANRRSVDLVVVHTMEAVEKPETAENVARWISGRDAPRVSFHYAVDSDSIVQCVREEHVAWAAPKMNHNGIQVEHAGYAKQSMVDWSDSYSVAMLDLSALLVAHICKRWSIPARWLTVDELREGERGIVTHHDGTLAFKVVGGHVDPGKNFPKERYIDNVAMNLALL